MQGLIGLPRWRLSTDQIGGFSFGQHGGGCTYLRSFFSERLNLLYLNHECSAHLSPFYTQCSHHLLREIPPSKFCPTPHIYLWPMWVSSSWVAIIFRVLMASQWMHLLLCIFASLVWKKGLCPLLQPNAAQHLTERKFWTQVQWIIDEHRTDWPQPWPLASFHFGSIVAFLCSQMWFVNDSTIVSFSFWSILL